MFALSRMQNFHVPKARCRPYRSMGGVRCSEQSTTTAYNNHIQHCTLASSSVHVETSVKGLFVKFHVVSCLVDGLFFCSKEYSHNVRHVLYLIEHVSHRRFALSLRFSLISSATSLLMTTLRISNCNFTESKDYGSSRAPFAWTSASTPAPTRTKCRPRRTWRCYFCVRSCCDCNKMFRPRSASFGRGQSTFTLTCTHNNTINYSKTLSPHQTTKPPHNPLTAELFPRTHHATQTPRANPTISHAALAHTPHPHHNLSSSYMDTPHMRHTPTRRNNGYVAHTKVQQNKQRTMGANHEMDSICRGAVCGAAE